MTRFNPEKGVSVRRRDLVVTEKQRYQQARKLLEKMREEEPERSSWKME